MIRILRSVNKLASGFVPVAGLLMTAVPAVDAGPASDEFQINQLTTGDQQSPDVAATADGGFLVVWQSPATPGDDQDLAVVGRRLDASGAPLSVSPTTTALVSLSAPTAASPATRRRGECPHRHAKCSNQGPQ